MQTTNDLRNIFTEVANAIREKTGKTNSLSPYGFAEEILSIQQGQPGTGENTLKTYLSYMGCDNLFAYKSSLTEIDSFFDPSATEDITSMSGMFMGCSSLVSVPALATQNVTNMQFMFQNCRNLREVAQIDTSNVSNMSFMFYGCSNLQTIPSLNTSKVTDMSSMFSNSGITSVPNIDLSAVIDASSMFESATQLSNIDGLTYPKATNISKLLNSSGISAINNMSGPQVSNAHQAFSVCSNLQNVNKVSLPKATNVSFLFTGCANLETVSELDLCGDDFDTTQQSTCAGLLSGCSSLITTPTINLSKFKDASGVFGSCVNLKTAPLALDVSSAINIGGMFDGCTSLESMPQLITGSDLNDASHIFSNCTALKNVDGLSLPYTTSVYNMFHNCTNLETVDNLTLADNANVSQFFWGCENLKEVCQLPRNSSGVLLGCYNIQKADFKGYDSLANNCFGDCHSLKTIIFRNINPDYQPSISPSYDWMPNCYHFSGTVDETYNPNGVADGRIYLPASALAHEWFKNYENGGWYGYKDYIRPIYSQTIAGHGETEATQNENGETIWSVLGDASTFIGWYSGDTVKGPAISTPLEQDESYNSGEWGFTLNSQGYYQNTNQRQDSSTCIMRFKIGKLSAEDQLRVSVLQSSENNFDFGSIGFIDQGWASDDYAFDYRGADAWNSPKVDYIDIPAHIDFNAESHFIDVAYTKDGSSLNGEDTFQIKIEHLSTSNSTIFLSPDAVLLSTETSINIGVVNEQTMDPINLVAVFEGGIPVEPDPDEPDPDEPDIPDEPDPDDPVEPDSDGVFIEGESPADEENPWYYDEEFGMYVNGNQNEQGTVSCIRFNFTTTDPNQRLKITYYQEVGADPNFGCIGNVDEEFNHYYTEGDQLHGVNMYDIYNEREVVYRDNISPGEHFIDIKFAYNVPDSSTNTFMVKVELISSTEPDEPDEPGSPEIRLSTNGSPYAYDGITYSTDDGESWQSFPRYTYDDFDAAEDIGYITVLENINQIKFRVAGWYSLECEELGIYIHNEEDWYEDSENCIVDGPATLYAEQLD